MDQKKVQQCQDCMDVMALFNDYSSVSKKQQKEHSKIMFKTIGNSSRKNANEDSSQTLEVIKQFWHMTLSMFMFVVILFVAYFLWLKDYSVPVQLIGFASIIFALGTAVYNA